MFSFIIYDQRTGFYGAARDHIGITSLYLGRGSDGSVWIASEMKSLARDCPDVEQFKPVLTQRLFPNVSELQGRIDGVFMRPHRLDAVVVAVRESTRLVNVQRQFCDGIVPRRATAGAATRSSTRSGTRRRGGPECYPQHLVILRSSARPSSRLLRGG